LLHRVADQDLARPREGLDLKSLPLVPDAQRVLDDPDVQIVIELLGGLEPARSFILRAFQAGKHVVTANKALLAHHGAELFDEARRRGVMFGFEAAVAGGIPLIRSIKEGLAANRILSVHGIINGTSNYILTKMTEEGRDFAEVLKEAQAKGYAEADPTLDVEGLDSAHKLQILATLAFRTSVDLKDIYTEGITAVTRQDIAYAAELGYRIKLLAIAKASDGRLEIRVHPTMIPASSPLAAVSGVFNAVFITGDAVGDLMFYGRGAGQMPTASAVWSDVLEIARSLAHGVSSHSVELPSIAAQPLPLQPMDEIRCPYYLRVMALDRPGVLSQVAGILGQHNISITSVLQKGRAAAEAVPVVMMTHEAREADMRHALAAIDKLPVVAGKTVSIRVEGGEL
ncbi:MAG: homoserine dehydrogenase, partial [Candidatus Rokubacteria bacterium RIFCSPHIGHO2_02_FULL_69_13]